MSLQIQTNNIKIQHLLLRHQNVLLKYIYIYIHIKIHTYIHISKKKLTETININNKYILLIINY